MSTPMFVDRTVIRSVKCDKCGKKEVIDENDVKYSTYLSSVSRKTSQDYGKYFQRQGWRVDPHHVHIRYCPDCAYKLGILKRRRNL